MYHLLKVMVCAAILMGVFVSESSADVRMPGPPGTPIDAESAVWKVEEILSGNTARMRLGDTSAIIHLSNVKVPSHEISASLTEQAKLFGITPAKLMHFGLSAKQRLGLLMPVGHSFLVVNESAKVISLPLEISGYVWKETRKNPNSMETDYTFINAEMLSSGLGWLVVLPTKTLYSEKLWEAANSAVKGQVGLWSLK